MKPEKIYKIILLLILGSGLLLRVVSLGDVPKGLQSDEASFLINSVSILETGRDEDGKLLPLYLDSLIDSKPALYSYLQIPFIKAFGATTSASRLPSALIGVLSIFLFYLLIDSTFNNKRLALLSAFLLAISPWHIMNSRATQEVILSLTLIIANLFAAQKLYSKKFSKKYLALFFITALLGMYVYHAAKIILVLFYLCVATLVVFSKKRSKSQLKTSLYLVILILISFGITASAALTRFSAIGLLNDDLPKALIFDYTTKSTPFTPLYAIRAFYNKPIMYFTYFLETYLSHFDLNFLFVNGGATRRFSVPHQGLLYMFELLFIPLGIFALIKKHTKQLLPWFLLLVLSPIPAALTTEEIPSSIRAFTMIIPLTLASALGFEWLLKNLNKYVRTLFVIFSLAAITWSVGLFVQQLFVMMPIQNTLYRSRSYEVVSKIIAEKESYYDSIEFTSDLREMYIYLWQQDLIEISQIQSQPLARYEQSYNLGKYYFNQNKCDFSDASSNSLLIAPYSCAKDLSSKYRELKTANFDDGTPGFVLFEN